MKRTLGVMFSAVAVLVATLVAAEMMHCTECGMMVDPASKFSSRIVQKDKVLPFCDIGDLLAYLNKNNKEENRPEVKDYVSGEWMDGRTAFYVHGEKKFQSPMGWGIAAFKNRKDASGYGTVLDFQGALKAVR